MGRLGYKKIEKFFLDLVISRFLVVLEIEVLVGWWGLKLVCRGWGRKDGRWGSRDSVIYFLEKFVWGGDWSGYAVVGKGREDFF